MSNYESQWGDIKLPAADFTRIRKAFEVAEKSKQAEAYEHTQKFWKSLSRKQQNDPAEYEKARTAYVEAHVWPVGNHDVFAQPDGTLVEKFQDMTHLPRGWDRETHQPVFHHKPARVKQSDVDWANNRTTAFTSGEASVTFNREASSLTWRSGHNNHQVDSAHGTWISQKMFDELRKVRWTRGTGGKFMYASEYQEDGVPRDSEGFGPVGFEQVPGVARDYVDTKGAKHSAKTNLTNHYREMQKRASARQQRKGEQGVPTTNRGHFGYSTRGESSRGLGGGSHLG